MPDQQRRKATRSLFWYSNYRAIPELLLLDGDGEVVVVLPVHQLVVVPAQQAGPVQGKLVPGH